MSRTSSLSWAGVLAVLVIATLMPSVSAAPVGPLDPITEPGVYHPLTNNIEYDGLVWESGIQYFYPYIEIWGDDVIIDGDGYSITGVNWDETTAVQQAAIYVRPGVKRFQIRNFTITGKFDTGILVNGNNTARTEDGWIINNNVHHLSSRAATTSQGIAVGDTTRVHIISNTVSDNPGEGIIATDCVVPEISRNIVSNNADMGISLVNAGLDYDLVCSCYTFGKVSTNQVTGNGKNGIYLVQSFADAASNACINNGEDGINVTGRNPFWWWAGDYQYPSIHRNMVMQNGRDGIALSNSIFNWYWPQDPDRPMDVWQNLVTGNGRYGVLVADHCAMGRVSHNILMNNVVTAIQATLTENFLFDNNIFLNNPKGFVGTGITSSTIRNSILFGWDSTGIELEPFNDLNPFIRDPLVCHDVNIMDNILAGARFNITLPVFEPGKIEVPDLKDPEVFKTITSSGSKTDAGIGTGIYLRGSSSQLHTFNNNIAGNYVLGAHDGVHLYLADNNNIYTNHVLGNGGLPPDIGYGISLEFSESNLLYDNYFNNWRNIGGVIGNRNVWTLYKRGVPNIVGGRNTGGNYWARPDGNGHSQVYANKHDAEGFISENYAIDFANIDTLPLWNPLNVTLQLVPEGDPQTLPARVHGIGSATGRPDLWVWDFGDGTPKVDDYYLNDVWHEYPLAGLYQIRLDVYDLPGRFDYDGLLDLGGATGSAVVPFIAGTPGLLSVFTADPASGKAPLAVTFTDQSIGSPENWTWDFGDGQTSNLRNPPAHIYSRAEVYPVTLTVQNGTAFNTSVQNIVVNPDAKFSWHKADKASPLTIQFTDETAGEPDTYLWTFGDGATSTEKNPVHVYKEIGVYAVALAVNAHGLTDSISRTVDLSVSNTLEAAFAATPKTGAIPLTVAFVDQSTGDPTTWEWDFGDGSLKSSERNPTHVYEKDGTWTTTLKVGNGSAWSGLTHSEKITAVLPELAAAYSASPRSGPAPLKVDFTDLSTGSPTAWEWNFGDGSVHSFEQNPTHTYSAKGHFPVTLTIRNAEGKTAVADSLTVEVGDLTSPSAAFTATPRSGLAPLKVQFVDQSTGNPVEWKWEYWSEKTGQRIGQSNDQSPVFTFNDPGTYRVVLTVRNDVGGSSTEDRSTFIAVSTLGAPTVQFEGSPVDGTLGPAGEGVRVQFLDKSGESPTSWLWEFGNGATSSLQSPSYIYTRAGKYTVTLTASNAKGVNSTTKTNYIYIRNTPPEASFSMKPTNGTSPMMSQFTDTSGGAGISRWVWNFGDGATATVTDPAARNVVHTYVNQGTAAVTYYATLTVTNDGGSDTSDSIAVTVYPQQGPISPDTLQLYQGWNFVSVPKKLASGNHTASQVFGTLDMDKHAILLYDAVSGAWKQVKANDELKPLDGIWIYAKSEASIKLVFNETAGPSVPPSKFLKQGWNAIGLANDEPTVARDALLSLDEKWVNVIGYHDGAKPDDPIIRGSSDPTKSDLIRQLYPTKGYWIWMSEDGTLQGMV